LPLKLSRFRLGPGEKINPQKKGEMRGGEIGQEEGKGERIGPCWPERKGKPSKRAVPANAPLSQKVGSVNAGTTKWWRGRSGGAFRLAKRLQVHERMKTKKPEKVTYQ